LATLTFKAADVETSSRVLTDTAMLEVDENVLLKSKKTKSVGEFC